MHSMWMIRYDQCMEQNSCEWCKYRIYENDVKLLITSGYMYNGWRKSDIMLKFIIEPYAKVIVKSLYAKHVHTT